VSGYDCAVAAESSTQYVAYTLYKVDPAWRRLPVEERAAGKEALAEAVSAWQERMELRTYTLVGVRPEVDFLFWKLTERYDDLRELAVDINATPLAGYLTTPYSYLAATKPSQYFESKSKRPRRVVPRGAPYLVVYPFVKKREWYSLPVDDRRRAMTEHAAVGSRFVTITNHTTYSFGIDDQEFMTAFECESPADFLQLMMTLRETEASRYTERDTPIFVGTAQALPEILDSLDGAAARVGASRGGASPAPTPPLQPQPRRPARRSPRRARRGAPRSAPGNAAPPVRGPPRSDRRRQAERAAAGTRSQTSSSREPRRRRGSRTRSTQARSNRSPGR
jgi:chlorite dismutase